MINEINYIEQEQFVKSKLDSLHKEINVVLSSLEKETNRNTKELKFLKKEVQKMNFLDLNFNNFKPTYPFVINEFDISNDLRQKLMRLGIDFQFCQSIIKHSYPERNQLTDKQILFINNANAVLDIVIKDIILLSEKKSRDLILLQIVKNEIENMIENLSKVAYMPSYPRIIVDGWEYNEEFLKILSKLNYEYDKL